MEATVYLHLLPDWPQKSLMQPCVVLPRQHLNMDEVSLAFEMDDDDDVEEEAAVKLVYYVGVEAEYEHQYDGEAELTVAIDAENEVDDVNDGRSSLQGPCSDLLVGSIPLPMCLCLHRLT